MSSYTNKNAGYYPPQATVTQMGPNITDHYHQTTMLDGGQTVMPLEEMSVFLNCPGPVSYMSFDEGTKVHKLRIDRIWFTIPAPGIAYAAPLNGTLYLTFTGITDSSNIMNATALQSTNGGVINSYVPPSALVDTGATSNNIMRNCVLVCPLDNVFTPAVEETKMITITNPSKVEHDFVGQAKGFHKMHIRLLQGDGTQWPQLDRTLAAGIVRIFIEMHMWVERRP